MGPGPLGWNTRDLGPWALPLGTWAQGPFMAVSILYPLRCFSLGCPPRNHSTRLAQIVLIGILMAPNRVSTGSLSSKVRGDAKYGPPKAPWEIQSVGFVGVQLPNMFPKKCFLEPSDVSYSCIYVEPTLGPPPPTPDGDGHSCTLPPSLPVVWWIPRPPCGVVLHGLLGWGLLLAGLGLCWAGFIS